MQWLILIVGKKLVLLYFAAARTVRADATIKVVVAYVDTTGRAAGWDHRSLGLIPDGDQGLDSDGQRHAAPSGRRQLTPRTVAQAKTRRG